MDLLIPAVPDESSDSNDRTQLVFKEFHIIYNVAHEVPTVFFRVMTEGIKIDILKSYGYSSIYTTSLLRTLLPFFI